MKVYKIVLEDNWDNRTVLANSFSEAYDKAIKFRDEFNHGVPEEEAMEEVEIDKIELITEINE